MGDSTGKIVFDSTLIAHLKTLVLSSQNVPLDNTITCECDCIGEADDIVSYTESEL